MTCKLHIPHLYDPKTETLRCDCGAVVIRKEDALNRGEGWYTPDDHISPRTVN